MTAYTLTPMGLDGLDKDRATVVDGPELPATPTREDLLRGLIADNERLRQALALARPITGGVERLQERYDEECALRVLVQRRLDRADAALVAIARRFAVAAGLVETAREEIGRSGDA